jgi:TPR repeat protein
MKPQGVALDEQIKWWDTLEVLNGAVRTPDADKGVQMARECLHPDAQWLASLFTPGVQVTKQRMADVMAQQGDDPRALFVRWGFFQSRDLLERSAELGYAPAQADMSSLFLGENEYMWAARPEAQGDRYGTIRLASCYDRGIGCKQDPAKAVELFKRAAEWGDRQAQFAYGSLAFRMRDWQRFHWYGISASRGVRTAVVGLLGALGLRYDSRIIHTIAPIFAANYNAATGRVFGASASAAEVADIERLLGQHNAMLERAREAIDCWSVASRRLGVAKDVRVLIAKMAWEEPWRWGEKEKNEKNDISS